MELYPLSTNAAGVGPSCPKHKKKTSREYSLKHWKTCIIHHLFIDLIKELWANLGIVLDTQVPIQSLLLSKSQALIVLLRKTSWYILLQLKTLKKKHQIFRRKKKLQFSKLSNITKIVNTSKYKDGRIGLGTLGRNWDKGINFKCSGPWNAVYYRL